MQRGRQTFLFDQATCLDESPFAIRWKLALAKWKFSQGNTGANDIDLVRKAFAENRDQIAAIILEPIPANAGLYFPREDFLPSLRSECTKRLGHDISTHAIVKFGRRDEIAL